MRIRKERNDERAYLIRDSQTRSTLLVRTTDILVQLGDRFVVNLQRIPKAQINTPFCASPSQPLTHVLLIHSLHITTKH